jgi:hypothetical protein
MQESLDLGLSSLAASSSGAPAAPAPPPSSTSQPSPSDAPAPRQNDGRATPDRVKVGEREFSVQELNDLAARHSAEESKRLTLPADPNGYKVELPQDFKVPEGMTFEFQARAFAHEAQLPQDAFSKLLSIHAASQVEAAQTLAYARQAEINKLGVNGTARITAVTQWLKAVGGQDAETLVRVLDYAPHSATVQAFENLMRKFSSQGGAAFSQQHRTQPDPGKIPGYEGMSFEQRRHSQDLMNHRR